MEHKSHRIRTANLPGGKQVYLSTKRPLSFIIIALLISLMVFLMKYLYLSVLMLIVAIIFYIVFLRKQISGYENFMVIYNQMNEDYCDIIYFSEISYWEYRITGKGDRIVLYLNDGERYRIENGVNNSTHSYLHKYLGDKEIKNREDKQSKGL